jgi:hypothetical protein
MKTTIILIMLLMISPVAETAEFSYSADSEIGTSDTGSPKIVEDQLAGGTADLPEVPDSEITQESVKQDKSVSVYRGAWFDIEYPSDFSAAPNEPLIKHDDRSFVQTDEALFTSSDKTVQFFVYSPLWAGEPNDYLVIADSEEIVSEQTSRVEETERPGQVGGREVRWVTVKATDGSYYRSFMSVREQIGTGSDLHHVFGIRYNDDAAYQTYKDAYIVFRESLRQYAD